MIGDWITAPREMLRCALHDHSEETLHFNFNQSNAMNDQPNLAQQLEEIEHRMALKQLVDTFSILADRKETQQQTLLFTDDGMSETYVNGQLVSSLRGRQQLAEAFGGFLSKFDAVYHLNGQQTVTLTGDTATGTSYCQVTLIGPEDGRQLKTTIGAYYEDEFVRQSGQWLIAWRKATFAWQDKQVLGQ